MIKLIFKITATKEAYYPTFTGHILRGAILSIINEEKPTIAEILHESNKMRPYSIAPLSYQEIRWTKRGEVHIIPGDSMSFQLNIFDKSIEYLILQIFESKEIFQLKLFQDPFLIEKIEVIKNEFSDLLSFEKKLEKFRFKFLTPTYFSIRKQKFPLRFPDPRYLFANLSRIWNNFNKDIQINEEMFHEWVSNSISVTGYNLETSTLNISKGIPKIGFKGWVNYKIYSEEKKYQMWIDVLAKFAEFSNIGGGRTAGFGCVKYIP